MARADTERVIRLKGAIDSAAAIPPDAAAASALTEAYQRLRSQGLEIAEIRSLASEFEAMFPEVNDPDPPPDHPREALHVAWRRKAEIDAQRASALLQALAGWMEGLLVSQRQGSP